MVTGMSVPGRVPVHALRSSAYAGGVRDGVAAANVAWSSPEAAKSFDQSTRGAGAESGGSTCGGAASKRWRRPTVSTITSVMPLIVTGGSVSVVDAN